MWELNGTKNYLYFKKKKGSSTSVSGNIEDLQYKFLMRCGTPIITHFDK
jgi:hypothetical protein